LVTYPTIIGDYSSVLPITKNINLLKKFKKEGHEIIIHTARRMLTHKGNVGKVMKDIAMITFNTVDKFNIEYDEIIFGKPIADIYIDDRSINPYYDNISFFGFFEDNNEIIINKIPNNKYNKITKINNSIIKIGPEKIMRGELYFYQNIPNIFKDYFTKLFNYKKNNDTIELTMEYISGIPLYFLYKNKTLTTKIIDDLFDILRKFHSYNNNFVITDKIEKLVYDNYFKKLDDRFNKNDYNFIDAEEVYNNIIDGLKNNYFPEIVEFIHGDFWFSNIILTYDDKYKFIDMKGQLYEIENICGDKYYDYGKLYQSILGYDLILNNIDFDDEYINNMKIYFLLKCKEDNLNLNYLTYVTKSLVFGTFHFLNDNNPKEKIWNFLKKI
jgi:capsule biosynthesis phosphatase